MKFKEFRKKMQKGIFSTAEAHVVGFADNPKLLNLQLHQWKIKGDILQLKRGLFMFADATANSAQVAESLYAPCYFSLEYALSRYGIFPEAVFSYTLVTTKKTCQFKTPAGHFIYRHITKETFTGFYEKTLMAEPEKALVDYFYLQGSRLKEGRVFWEESRLNGSSLRFQKIFFYAKLFKSARLIRLLTDFKRYAKTHEDYR